MANMSYCRFHNTGHDLDECLNALSDENEYEIGTKEVKCGIEMFKTFLDFCIDNGIIDDYQDEKIERIFTEHNEMVQDQGNELKM